MHAPHAARRRVAAIVLTILLAVVAASRGADAAPPQVIEASPATGDGAVDAATREIRVTFDQLIDRTAGYSFVGGGETFPEVAGQPRWADDRTVVLAIRLKPDRDYRVGVNGERHRNFRNAAGESATPYTIEFTSAGPPANVGGAAEAALTRELNRAAVDQVRAALRERLFRPRGSQGRLGPAVCRRGRRTDGRDDAPSVCPETRAPAC